MLAPLIVLAASLLARRVGPEKAGLFIGLPTTSLPFTLAVWLGLGTTAAVEGAAGGVTGQLACVLFGIAYCRLAPVLPPLRAMFASIALAMLVAFPTLLLDNVAVPLLLAIVFAVLALVTWPAAHAPSAAASETRRGTRNRDIIVRMVAAGVTVTLTASLAPHLGPLLAGAFATLPTILIVMGPSVHRAEGSQVAVDLVRGTVATIPGTAAFVALVATTGATLGIPIAIALGLVAVFITYKLVELASISLSHVIRTPRPATA